MHELVFEPSARESWLNVQHDPMAEHLAGRVAAAFRLLAQAPGDSRCRRRSYGPYGWGMPVRARDDDWLIVWRTGDQGEVIVRYVGPDI